MIEVLRSLPLTIDEVYGRTLEGQALEWDKLYRVTDNGGRSWYEEGFRRGAFARTLVARRNTFELRSEHDDVRAGVVSFHEDASGLGFVAVLDETAQGEAELDAVRAHRRNGVSIRYTPLRHVPVKGPPWWRCRVELRELSLTSRPQYEGAGVTAMRSAPWKPPPEHAALLDWTPPAL